MRQVILRLEDRQERSPLPHGLYTQVDEITGAQQFQHRQHSYRSLSDGPDAERHGHHLDVLLQCVPDHRQHCRSSPMSESTSYNEQYAWTRNRDDYGGGERERNDVARGDHGPSIAQRIIVRPTGAGAPNAPGVGALSRPSACGPFTAALRHIRACGIAVDPDLGERIPLLARSRRPDLGRPRLTWAAAPPSMAG